MLGYKRYGPSLIVATRVLTGGIHTGYYVPVEKSLYVSSVSGKIRGIFGYLHLMRIPLLWQPHRMHVSKDTSDPTTY